MMQGNRRNLGSRARTGRIGPACQRGNSLVYALMALVVGALLAATQLQAQINNSKLNTGSAEGGVLGALADAGNSMVTEQLVTIQQGSPITKNGVTVTPTTVGSDLVWIVAISDLKGMNYLPSSWNITKSTINNAPYALSFKRSPTGCAPVNCSIDGSVVLTGSINDTGATGAYDSVVVGAILNKLGVRGGVSLPQSPGTITGYGNSWSIPNPVGGTPPGVAAAYFGTTSGTNSQFVRIQDSRNPDLQGALSVAGNISTPAGISGNTINATTSVTAGGAVTGATFKSANNCFQVDASGRVGTSCFSPTDMPAGWAGGVSTGDVYSHSNIGVGTGGAISASLKSDGAIRGAAGDFMVANNGVIGLNAKGTSGAACSSSTGNVGALTVDSSGTLLNCVGGVWRPVGGRQQKQTFYIASDGAVVPSPGCPSTSTAQIIVVPATIYVNPTAAISYTGPGSGPWTINIRDGSNAPVPGATAQVETYCAYS